jgi:demethylmenaquinone methyltransferase/2-methoxy-6-polyprenyl-1,4-benzoquinol methylase
LPEFVHTGPDKKRYVREMFDDISPRYDFLNHLLSFGIDFYWRRRLVSELPDNLPAPLLDVATGTGDVGIAVKHRRPEVLVVGLDYAYRMTRLCRAKIEKRRLTDFVVLQGDGEALPFPDRSFAALTIAFGFRNIGHYSQALVEFHRVLIPGGRLLILEFGEPNSRLFGTLYRFYFRRILPWIGAWFSRSDAYRYLPESVAHFPEQKELLTMLLTAGFAQVTITDLTLGVVQLIHAVRSPANSNHEFHQTPERL